MSLDGVGLSLVNSKPDEVAYITLSRCVNPSVACSKALGERILIYPTLHQLSYCCCIDLGRIDRASEENLHFDNHDKHVIFRFSSTQLAELEKAVETLN